MRPVSGRSTELGPKKLFEFALRALARKPHTVAELRKKLSRRCADEREVADVLQRLLAYRYVDDGQVAKSYSEFRRDCTLLGRRRVLNELLRRGVDQAVAESAVAEAYQNTDEVELARAFLRRKLCRRLSEVRVESPKQMARLYAALARAGFGAHATSRALSSLSADPELLDAVEVATAEA
ncbi:MAG: RecX family transcriptional regulator [Bryobacterales bacterium]|nr:RecX family transcriptional regulator [Bryobacterales bacterium]